MLIQPLSEILASLNWDLTFHQNYPAQGTQLTLCSEASSTIARLGRGAVPGRLLTGTEATGAAAATSDRVESRSGQVRLTVDHHRPAVVERLRSVHARAAADVARGGAVV